MSKWTIEDTVILVVSGRNKVMGIHQAYFVSLKSKNSLESAKRWAGENHEIHTLQNGGFKLQILKSAGSSNQGGKLSFWNCLITKDDFECVVGINAEYLCSLLCHNVFNYGECLENVYLARADGNVAAITEKMPEYETARDYMALKEARSKKKTTKWIPGCNYITTTLDEIYVGKVYTPLHISNNSYRDAHIDIDFNAQKHIIAYQYDKTKDNLFDALFNEKDYGIYQLRATNKTCPSRQQGDVSLKVNNNFGERLQSEIGNYIFDRLKDDDVHCADIYKLDIIFQTFNRNISKDAMRYLDLCIERQKKISETRQGRYMYSKDIIVKHNGQDKRFYNYYEALKYVKEIFNENGFTAE